MEQNILLLVLSCCWAFLIAIFAVPSIIRVAQVKNIFDQPNLRTIHENLIPRLGGGAVFAGFMSALTIFTDLDNGVQQLLAACILLFFIGLKDDLINISALKKFSVQLLAAGVVICMSDIRITSFYGILGIWELDLGISYGFTFLVVIGITNSINLIDGLDGLAGSLVVVIASALGIYFYMYGGTAYSNYAAVAFSLVGSVAGFLRYNFYRASIFMGDTGSLLCGFILSVLTIQFIEMRGVSSAPSIAIGILFIPIFDTIRVLLIRIMQGQSPFMPDKRHIHHKLLEMGLSQIWTVFVIIITNLIIIALVIKLENWGNESLLLLLLALSIVFSVFLGVYKLNSTQSVPEV
jgi:UDP-GlcNAc:undecaprenyl-phosphate/decaprenyl-phosphate GlcNAc-1-phosphate transferase